MRSLHPALLALHGVLLLGACDGGCVPGEWSSGALLYPHRRPVPSSPPPGARSVELAGDGVTLRGWSYAAKGTRRGALVYLHGVGDNRASSTGVATTFTRHGFDVLAYDSRAHGESDGQYCTYGYHERRDLRAVVSSLPEGPVILLGSSLGASVALQAAPEIPRVRGVAAIAPFSALRTIAEDRAPAVMGAADIEAGLRHAEQTAGFDVDVVSAARAAARITVPVLLVHGADDTDTPPAHSRRIHAALAGPKELILVRGVGHNQALGADIWRRIERFIIRAAARRGGEP